MIQSFRHKGLEKFFLTGSLSGIRADHARKLRLVLARLSNARTPSDMALPGLRLHPLQGQLRGSFAVAISGNWRVTFRFRNPHAFDVDYLDYH
jgi:proteic killer suppression protein